MTRETEGLRIPATISAMARPASTSPPTVLSTSRKPFVFSLCSMLTSRGRMCSYLVALLVSGRTMCPSICPMMETQAMGLSGVSAAPSCAMDSAFAAFLFSGIKSTSTGSMPAKALAYFFMRQNAAKERGWPARPTTAVQNGAEKMRRATSLTSSQVVFSSRSRISSKERVVL